MGRVCTICSHQDRDQIERGILSGVAYRRLAAQYGTTEASIRRHIKEGHVSDRLIQTSKQSDIATADGLISDLVYLRETAIQFLEQAKEAEDRRSASGLITSALRVIEVMGEVRGELDRKATVNILINPEYVETRTKIVKAVSGCRHCREKIAELLLNES